MTESKEAFYKLLDALQHEVKDTNGLLMEGIDDINVLLSKTVKSDKFRLDKSENLNNLRYVYSLLSACINKFEILLNKVQSKLVQC